MASLFLSKSFSLQEKHSNSFIIYR